MLRGQDPYLTRAAMSFAALGHPLRLAVFVAMALNGEQSPKMIFTELRAQRDDATLALVAYHVRTLKNAGMVRETRQPVQRRGALEHFYELSSRGHRVWGLVGPVLDDE